MSLRPFLNLYFIRFNVNFDKNTQKPVILDLGVEPVRMEATVLLDANAVKIPTFPGESHWGWESERLFLALNMAPRGELFRPPNTYICFPRGWA